MGNGEGPHNENFHSLYRSPNMRRQEDRIRMNLNGLGFNRRNLVDSAQDRDYWRVLVNVRVL